MEEKKSGQFLTGNSKVCFDLKINFFRYKNKLAIYFSLLKEYEKKYCIENAPDIKRKIATVTKTFFL